MNSSYATRVPYITAPPAIYWFNMIGAAYGRNTADGIDFATEMIGSSDAKKKDWKQFSGRGESLIKGFGMWV